MQEIIICLTALLASGLTFFSGFGLGTILLPVFAVFFPLDLAIALTAIVHFLNNIFKFFLTGKHIDKAVLLRFGLPSIVAALLGAWLLGYLTDLQAFYSYKMYGTAFEIRPVKVVIALLLVFFALFDLIPKLKNLQIPQRYLPIGGLISGFFGGLSGHQGALRSAFLIRSGMTKEAFIATGIVIACFVDVSRLTVYSGNILELRHEIEWSLVVLATLSAFVGALLGSRFLKKMTLETVQVFVAAGLIIFAVFLGLGII